MWNQWTKTKKTYKWSKISLKSRIWKTKLIVITFNVNNIAKKVNKKSKSCPFTEKIWFIQSIQHIWTPSGGTEWDYY